MKPPALAGGVLVVALAAALVTRSAITDDDEALVVVHWSNSHPLREGLLPEMAEQFNDADHETSSGRPIEVLVVPCDSSVQADDLVARVAGSGPAEDGCDDGDGGSASDPTIVTPQSDDWLVDVNHRAGREVIDLEATDSLAETWLGIVTYRAMAECLGWPEKEIGYADILALRSDPLGWQRHADCARAEWGTRPLLAFTNPTTSTSGRNVLVSLYSIAAGKQPADLTISDVERPEVVDYVKAFQGLVDHYMPGTIPLNTKIAQGPRYGQFFLMPEDNLVSLYKGNEKAIAADGTEQPVDQVKDLVMIYPKEGSVLNANPAGVVDAPWVTAEHASAAHEWIDFVRDDDQQRRFMDAGFRPTESSELVVDPQQMAEWGLDAEPPRTIIEPGELAPPVLERIIGSWGAVKNPAIVTFVVDVSGSMEGEPLLQVQEGLTRVLDAMSGPDGAGSNNQVGLVTFSDDIITEIPPGPLRETKFSISDAINAMTATGQTSLYTAVERAVRLSDGTPGDPRSTRAVVVLSDGAATTGTCLDAIVSMRSRDEVPVSSFCGMEGQSPVDDREHRVELDEVNGEALRLPHDNEVQVFFLGFGTAEVDIGRILAQATGAEYQGSTEEDLAAVIEALSGYF